MPHRRQYDDYEDDYETDSDYDEGFRHGSAQQRDAYAAQQARRCVPSRCFWA